MSKERQLLSLNQLKKECEKQAKSNKDVHERYYSTIGLVVDCSNIFRYENNRDFTQKFKIIDGSQAEPLQVYLWSNRREDFSLNVKVGDILFLNNFKVEIFKENLQAKKAFKVEDSYFRIFSGNPALTNYSPVDKKVGLDDEDGKILNTIGDLRKYSKEFFKNSRVPLLFKSEGKEKKGEKKITSSDFDIILRVIESLEAPSHFKIRLTNQKEEYQLNYTRSIEPGVYKIRSVADAKWDDRTCTLTGNDYTYFLEISSWMKSFDPKEWDRLVPTQEKNRKIKRAKVESTTIAGKKKLNKLTLKELIAKGIS